MEKRHLYFIALAVFLLTSVSFANNQSTENCAAKYQGKKNVSPQDVRNTQDFINQITFKNNAKTEKQSTKDSIVD